MIFLTQVQRYPFGSEGLKSLRLRSVNAKLVKGKRLHALEEIFSSALAAAAKVLKRIAEAAAWSRELRSCVKVEEDVS